MYALAQPKRAGRFGEDNDSQIDLPIQPPSPPRPASFGLEANRLTSCGDMKPTNRTRSPPRGVNRNIRTPDNRKSSANPDPLTEELLRMHQQQQEQIMLQDMMELQLQQEREMYAGLVPDPGPPPKTVYCRSRSNSTVSSISINEREWIDDPSLTSSNKSLREHVISNEEWEGVWQSAALKEEPSRHPSLSNHTSDRRSAERSEVLSGPELSDDLCPLMAPKRKMTIQLAARQEFTVWNPNVPAAHDVGKREEQQPENEDLERKPAATQGNRISPFCSMAETHQTFERLYPDRQELEAALPVFNEEAQPQEQDAPSEPHLQMEELRIEGMTEEEMIQLAVEASKRDEEERQRFISATFMAETVVVEDPAVTYSLEKLMEMPAWSERSNEHREVKPKGMRKVRNMLGLGRGTESPTRSF